MVRGDGGDGEIAVPPTIHALLQARIDTLDGDVRLVMERGAVEGEVFHRGSVAVGHRRRGKRTSTTFSCAEPEIRCIGRSERLPIRAVRPTGGRSGTKHYSAPSCTAPRPGSIEKTDISARN